METARSTSAGPDLAQGVLVGQLADGGMLLGHVGDEQVLLVRHGDDFYAVGATCTHYSGPLADGIVAGDTVRCPYHHACFSLKTGEALHASAFSPLPCWNVERRGDSVFVGDKKKPAQRRQMLGAARTDEPARIVIVGGGAAGFAAAEMLRRGWYEGELVIVSGEDAPPIDRPNLSKDYLAGKAPEDWMPLRSDDFYAENRIGLRLGARATGIDACAREVVLEGGTRLAYDRLLLATGAEPVRLSIPGAELPYVRVLRSLADSHGIIARAAPARRVVVLGASFIGLEVAAALRERNVEVHVVAPDRRPMERVLGPEMGDFVRALHEQHGVVFHLGKTPVSIDGERVALSGGGRLDADLVVAGIGVRPRTALAEAAGLTLDRGVAVDEFLETSAPGIFAAGDIARWPDPHTGDKIRVEHWEGRQPWANNRPGVHCSAKDTQKNTARRARAPVRTGSTREPGATLAPVRSISRAVITKPGNDDDNTDQAQRQPGSQPRQEGALIGGGSV
jgi:NADH dehydrogenase FAD-containing subunit/nitrite reductase/ring-hydroxylating ferredoxin subunit